MGLISVRNDLLRPAVLPKTLLLVGLVIALMAGLLAMHTIASTMTSHSEPATAEMTMPSELGDHPAQASQTPEMCVGQCASDGSMTAMMCVLALLFGGLLLLAGLSRTQWLTAAGLRTRMQSLVRLPAGPPLIPDPPDLLKLSISRT